MAAKVCQEESCIVSFRVVRNQLLCLELVGSQLLNWLVENFVHMRKNVMIMLMIEK